VREIFMPRSSLYRLAACFLSPGLATGADDRPPQKPEVPSETILSEKGLKLAGLSYILRDTEERDRQLLPLQPIAKERDRLQENVVRRHAAMQVRTTTRRVEVNHPREATTGSPNTTEEHYSYNETVDKDASTIAADKAAYEAAQREFADFVKEHADALRRYDSLVGETAQIYSGLFSDRAFIEAFSTINRQRRPKLVLGPVPSPGDYRASLERLDLALLAMRGVSVDLKARRLFLELEHQAGSLAIQAAQLFEDLKTAEKRVSNPSSVRHELRAMLQAAAREVDKAPSNRKQKAIAKFQMLNNQLKSLPHDDGEPDPAVKLGDANLVSLRKSFVAAVRALRERVDEAQSLRRRVEADADVTSALRDLRGPRGSTKITEPRLFHDAVFHLTRFERTVRSERIPLKKGLDGVLTLVVTLNSNHPVSMALDPQTATTQPPAALAEQIGAVPSPGAPAVSVLIAGSETVRARRAPLRSMEIGGLSIEGVSCLVLPAGAPTRVVLGTDILDHFVWEVDIRGTELTLTQVTPALASDIKPTPVRD
jgi:hypothetical protein